MRSYFRSKGCFFGTTAITFFRAFYVTESNLDPNVFEHVRHLTEESVNILKAR
jgi:hypothetical protein